MVHTSGARTDALRPGGGFADLASVARAMAAFGANKQLVYGDEVWTYADHAQAVRSLAASLNEQFQVEKGARVALAMRNFPEFSITFWATQLLGAILVPVNAWWQQPEVTAALDFTRPRVIITDDERHERVAPWADRERVPVISARTAREAARYDFDALIAGSGRGLESPPLDADDPATILFTSGTTGVPKGIVHTHANHLTTLHRATGVAAAAASGADRVDLATMPLFHISQLSSLYVTAALGGTSVTMYKWIPQVAADLIDEHGVTAAGGVPRQIEQLVDLAEAGRELPSLMSLGIGAANVPPHLPGRIDRVFGGRVVPLTGYGMTETTSSVTSISGMDYVQRPDSVGLAHPFNTLRVVRDGHEVGVGQVGEIVVSGPNVTWLEWDGSSAVAVRDKSDFILTGDLGRLDDEGFLRLAGRSKEMIIRAGENVYPIEIEAALAAYPGVEMCAVVGLPHPVWGEEVAAVIRPRSAEFDVDALIEHLSTRLAYFKVPTSVHLATEDFPTTATGKTLRDKLREQYAALAPHWRSSASLANEGRLTE